MKKNLLLLLSNIILLSASSASSTEMVFDRRERIRKERNEEYSRKIEHFGKVISLAQKSTEYISVSLDSNLNVSRAIKTCFEQSPHFEITIYKWDEERKEGIEKIVTCQRIAEIILLGKKEYFKSMKRNLYLSKFYESYRNYFLGLPEDHKSLHEILFGISEKVKSDYSKMAIPNELLGEILTSYDFEKIVVSDTEESEFVAKLFEDLNHVCMIFFRRKKNDHYVCDITKDEKRPWLKSRSAGQIEEFKSDLVKESLKRLFIAELPKVLSDLSNAYLSGYVGDISNQPMLLFLSDEIFEDVEDWNNQIESNEVASFPLESNLRKVLDQYIEMSIKNEIRVKSQIDEFNKLAERFFQSPNSFNGNRAIENYVESFRNDDQFKLVVNSEDIPEGYIYSETISEFEKKRVKNEMVGEMSSYAVAIGLCFVPIKKFVRFGQILFNVFAEGVSKALIGSTLKAFVCYGGTPLVASFYMGGAYFELLDLFEANHTYTSVDTTIRFQHIDSLSKYMNPIYLIF